MRLNKPYIDDREIEEVKKVLSSGYLTQGPKTEEFEQLVAQLVGCKYAFATSSCTTALHLSLVALGIGPRDEVLVADFTFPATANVVVQQGATPVLVDIDLDTFTMNIADMGAKITEKTKAIIPVHAFGCSADMNPIIETANKFNIPIIEDAACAIGTTYYGTYCGNLGTMGCFSFHPRKVITTGEGGMITTNDDKIDKKLRLLREHGMNRNALERESSTTWSYDVTDLGYNYRLTEPQAALGMAQLKRVDEGIRLRIRASKYYAKELCGQNSCVATPYTAPNRSHIFHLYTVKIKKQPSATTRDEVFKRLSNSGIQTSVHYTPLHMMSFYKQFLNKNSQHFPHAEKVYEEILSLPIYPSITRGQITTITSKISDACNQ